MIFLYLIFWLKMYFNVRLKKGSILALILLLCCTLVTVFNTKIGKAESNSLIRVRHFNIEEVLEGTNRDSLVGSFNALKGYLIKLNLSSYSTNNGPFHTSVRICSANHGVIFGAEGPNFSQIIQLDFEDTYNITIYKSPTFCCVQFIGVIDVVSSESSQNWVEVERFSGGSWWGGTKLFKIDNFEWRIRWNYEPVIVFGSDTAVVFDIQVLDAKSQLVELVRSDEKTTGTVNFHQSGEFYLYIIGFNTEDYTIIIEETIDSVPEFPYSDNWVEVTRFTENSEFLQRTFTIEHAKWRIRWEYEPEPAVSEETPALYVYVWDQEFPDKYFESILKNGANDTSGTLYIHNRTGIFFLGIIRTVKSFTLIIEQNIDSIPESPSWTILPLILTTLLFLVVVKRKLYTLNPELR